MRENKTWVIPGIEIRRCSAEDFLQGWVRIPKEVRGRGNIPNRSFARIKVNGKTIFCQIRGSDKHENCVEMGDHYRTLLDLEPGQKVDMTITRLDWVGGKLRTIAMHPNHMMRFGFGFSCAGLTIALIGLITFLLEAALSSMQSAWAWAGWVTIGVTVALTFLVGWLIAMTITIFTSRY